MIFDDYSYLAAGDSLPELNLISIEDGQPYHIEKGNFFLLNFFIIPCKHCKRMLEYLQEEFWPEFRESQKILLAVGREHTHTELQIFREKGNYILPLAADPDRSNYDKFAEKKVPRNYLFNSHGQLIYQTRGFDLDQMSVLRSVLREQDIE